MCGTVRFGIANFEWIVGQVTFPKPQLPWHAIGQLGYVSQPRFHPFLVPSSSQYCKARKLIDATLSWPTLGLIDRLNIKLASRCKYW
jgi:hypothetical protein